MTEEEAEVLASLDFTVMCDNIAYHTPTSARYLGEKQPGEWVVSFLYPCDPQRYGGIMCQVCLNYILDNKNPQVFHPACGQIHRGTLASFIVSIDHL